MRKLIDKGGKVFGFRERLRGNGVLAWKSFELGAKGLSFIIFFISFVIRDLGGYV